LNTKGEQNELLCPHCEAGKITIDDTSICSHCGSKFVNVGQAVYVREEILQKVAIIVKETDERITKIVNEKNIEDIEGFEGEVAGVISGTKTGSIILIDDFIVTGTPGLEGNYSTEPVLALEENHEKSELLNVIRRLYAERQIKAPLLMLDSCELEIIRKEANMERELFNKEINRLINSGQKRKVGTFHSHESAGSNPSEKDIGVIRLNGGDCFGKAFGENDAISAILSEFLIILENGSAREIGRIPVLESAAYDFENYT
jgi:hypothetical protein